MSHLHHHRELSRPVLIYRMFLHFVSRPNSQACRWQQLLISLLSSARTRQTDGGVKGEQQADQSPSTQQWLTVRWSSSYRRGEGTGRLEAFKSHKLMQKAKECRKTFCAKPLPHRSVLFCLNHKWF